MWISLDIFLTRYVYLSEMCNKPLNMELDIHWLANEIILLSYIENLYFYIFPVTLCLILHFKSIFVKTNFCFIFISWPWFLFPTLLPVSPPTPFLLCSALFHCYSEKDRPPIHTNEAWHTKLQQEESLWLVLRVGKALQCEAWGASSQ